jgi:hypothetical protein
VTQARYDGPMLLAVPSAELTFLPGVGLVPMVDDPALIANTILDFVDRISPHPKAK